MLDYTTQDTPVGLQGLGGLHDFFPLGVHRPVHPLRSYAKPLSHQGNRFPHFCQDHGNRYELQHYLYQDIPNDLKISCTPYEGLHMACNCKLYVPAPKHAKLASCRRWPPTIDAFACQACINTTNSAERTHMHDTCFSALQQIGTPKYCHPNLVHSLYINARPLLVDLQRSFHPSCEATL